MPNRMDEKYRNLGGDGSQHISSLERDAGSPDNVVDSRYSQYSLTQPENHISSRVRAVPGPENINDWEMAQHAGGGGGGGFDPDSIADLALWLDASDLTTLEFNGAQISGTDNDDVSQWLDKSSGPAAYCGADNTGNAAMKYRTSVNGYAGIQMGNTDRNYTRDASDGMVKVGTSQQITAFAVGATANSDAEVVLFALTDSSSGCVFLNLSTSNPPGGYSIRGTGASARESTTALRHFNFTTQDNNTGVRVATVRFGPVGGNVDIWRDGGDQQTIAAPATPCFDTGGNNASGLGEIDSLGDDPITQSLTTWYEVLVYDRELTDQEVSDVHDYLVGKYGIA